MVFTMYLITIQFHKMKMMNRILGSILQLLGLCIKKKPQSK